MTGHEMPRSRSIRVQARQGTENPRHLHPALYTAFCIALLLPLLASCSASQKKIVYSPDEYRRAVEERIREDDRHRYVISFPASTADSKDRIVMEMDVFTPPYAISGGTLEQVIECIGNTGNESVRFLQLRDCVINRPTKISYNGSLTLDAERCLSLREGNCFALTNLFIGAARETGLDSHYILVEDVISNHAEADHIFHTNHIVSGVIANNRRKIVDFIPNPREYRYTTTLSDLEASGLYLNNLGANLMLSGNLEEAMGLFTLADRLYPDSYLIHNNLGLLHMRLSDYAMAELHFEQAVAVSRFPDLVLGNLLRMYRLTGQQEKISSMTVWLKQVQKRNPYFYLSMAREALDNENFELALSLTRTARRIDSGIPEIYEIQTIIFERLDQAKKLRRAERRLARCIEVHL